MNRVPDDNDDLPSAPETAPESATSGQATDSLLKELESIRTLLQDTSRSGGRDATGTSSTPSAGAIPVLNTRIDGEHTVTDAAAAGRSRGPAAAGDTAAPGSVKRIDRPDGGGLVSSRESLFDEEWRRRTSLLLDEARARVGALRREAWSQQVQQRLEQELGAAVSDWVDHLVRREAAIIRQDLLQRFRSIVTDLSDSTTTGAVGNQDVAESEDD